MGVSGGGIGAWGGGIGAAGSPLAPESGGIPAWLIDRTLASDRASARIPTMPGPEQLHDSGAAIDRKGGSALPPLDSAPCPEQLR